jgi:ATP-dependent Lon protease
MMLDEIDKLGADYRRRSGGAAQILDPEQNNSFTDHYLDLLPVSKVFFIATANQLDRSAAARSHGLSGSPVTAIMRNFKLRNVTCTTPDSRERFDSEQLRGSPDSAIMEIATRLRVKQVCGNSSETLAGGAQSRPQNHEGQTEKVTVDGESIKREYLGAPPVFIGTCAQRTSGRSFDRHGLDRNGRRDSYSSKQTCCRAAAALITGQLGEIMQESARAAQSYLWSHAQEFGISSSMFKKYGVHLRARERHPQRWTERRVTITAALASLYTGQRACGTDTA